MLSLLATAGVYQDVVESTSASSMSFLVLGDWGGDSDSRPTTSAQVANGKGMASVGKSLDAKFVMAVGDNFYSSGIHGDDHSSRFTSSFEDAYPESELKNVPWYVVAGNHDHEGNVQAQIDYSGLSDRWNFPDYWYTWSESFTTSSGKSITTQVVYIDTVTFSGMSFKNETTGEIVTGRPHHMQSRASSQYEFLEKTLKESTADYLWVSGHYPIYSQCEHGPTSNLISEVLPLMRKYKASGFLAGHDHCLGHYDGVGDDAGMAFVLSGAGKECCYSPSNLHNSKNKGTLTFRMDSGESHGAKGGFASLTATESGTTVKYYNTNGDVLYTSTPVAPRN